jgi:hypothetical protein
VRKRLPSPAMGVALLALFVALGGTPLAHPVADGAVSLSAKVRKALGLAKKADRRSKQALALAGQGGQKGDPGAKGDQGPPGPKGDRGDAGPAGSIQGAPAGGDLTGSYPDPSIAADAVTGAEVQDATLSGNDLLPNSIFSGQIAPGTVQGGDMATGAVTAGELGAITLRTGTITLDATGQTAGNGSYDTKAGSVTCAGGEQAISIGAFWDSVNTTETRTDQLTISDLGFIREITTNTPAGVFVRGGNDTSASHTLTMQVACLAP